MAHPLLNIAKTAALNAGKIIVRGLQKLDRIQIEEKNPNDFVTEIDQKSEQLIIDTIHEAYPEHSILAEESGEHVGSKTQWIIDPLDGTTNFIHGVPHVAISIAVKHDRRLEHAVIYDPIRDELFSASRGQGAYVNERRMRVSQAKYLKNALLSTGYPVRYPELLETYHKQFSQVMKQCCGIRRAGAAALDLAYVAAGRLDAHWEYRLQPWDIAAGMLLIQEAGGLVSDFEGQETCFTTGNVVAGNPKIFKLLLKELQL